MSNRDLAPAQGVQGSSYLYDFGTSPNTRTAVSQKVRLLTPAYGSDANLLFQMGVLSSFTPNESRTIDQLRGIGFGDMIAELVPSVTEAMTASFERALLYLANLWQATGYAGGVSGPVRSLRHHRWPFDIEQQLVFSTLADFDLTGQSGSGFNGGGGTFDGGVKEIVYPQVTNDPNNFPGDLRGHTAIITLYETCWFNSWSLTNLSKDAGMLMETGDVTISDVHDFSSEYGEFLATGNDPTIGQVGSVRFNASDQRTASDFITV
jgi:hypothetical protein